MTQVTDARLILRVAGYFREVAGDGTVTQADFDVNGDNGFDFGNDEDETNSIWKSYRTLAAAASENLDLNNLPNLLFDGTNNMNDLKVLFIKAADDNRASIIVGGAASNPFSGPFLTTTTTIAIPPGGIFVIADFNEGGWSTGLTSDQLKVANSSSAFVARYQIAIIGSI